MASNAKEKEEKAKLEVLAGRRAGESIQLAGKSVVIGSDEAATFTCHDPDVEWSHARIYRSRNEFHIEDLQSQGGVTVNDKKVLNAVLASGDTIGIGSARFRFHSLNGNGNGNGAGNGAGGAEPSFSEGEPAHGARTEQIAVPPADVVDGAAILASAAAATNAPVDPHEAAMAVADAEVQAVLEEQRRRVAAFDAEAKKAEAGLSVPEGAGATGGDMSFAQIPPVPPQDDMSAPATVDDLIPVIEALREQNADLRVRLERAEAALQKKSEGLSLATESFVDQLERAKERIATFAKRHAETEAAVAARNEELEKLKLEHEALQTVASSRTKDLCEKIEAVRRDFDDLARVAASKGQHVAKLASEARSQVVATSGAQALQTLLAAAGAASVAAGAGKPTTGALIPVPAAEDLSISRSGGTSRMTRAAASVSVAPSSAPSASASFQASAPPASAPASGPVAMVRNIMKSEAVSLGAIFLIIAGAAFVIIWLFQMQPDRGRKGEPRGASTFAPVDKGEKAPPKPPASSTSTSVKPVAQPKTPPKTSMAPTGPSVAPPPVAVATAEGAADDEGGPIGQLRKAHRLRDEKAIKEAEQAIIAKGKDYLPTVREASDKERQFNIKVSLEYCIAALEGKDSARDVIEAMRNAKAPDEKMRKAFLLGKLNKPEDVPYLSEAAQTETDPMIKKYIVRALGNVPGAQGLDVLRQIAQGNTDRNLRIESIRAIEERGSSESESFLQDLARNEQDASIKSIAVRALASTGGRQSIQWFQGVLDSDERTNNRAEAAKFMSRVGEPGDVASLEAAYQKEKVYYIRQKIRQAIETIQRRNGIEPTPPPPDPQQGQVQEPQPVEEPK